MKDPIHESVVFSHRLRNLTQQLAKEAGIDWLSGPQGRVVLHLYHHQDQPLTAMSVTDRLHVSKPVASQLLKRMEKNGLIYFQADEVDKRRKYIRLTPTGLAHSHKVERFLRQVHTQLLEGVDDDELATFLKVLNQFTDNMQAVSINKGEFDD